MIDLSFNLEEFIKSIEESIKDAKIRIIDRECNLLALVIGEDVYLVQCRPCKVKGYMYVKIAPAHVYHRWSCEVVEYLPYGFYIFSKQLNELIDKLINKINTLRKLMSRISIEV